MAWQDYITKNLMVELDSERNTLDSAAILGHDGGVWAQSDKFPALSDEEAPKLLEALTSNDITSVYFSGVKYMKTQADGTTMRGRKDKSGFILRKTNQALVVGFYTEPTVAAVTCSKLVEALADYLEEQGY